MEKLHNLLKNRSFWGIIASIVVMAVVAFAYFYPDDMLGRELQQHDMRQGMANGQEAKLFEETTGETTRWTNSLFGGMPTFQIAPSYPSNTLFSWINTVMGLGLPSPANMLFMMMVGFFILLLAMKMRWYVALLGAIGYGLSSYFVIIIGAGHIWKFITLAYIPPTIAGIVLCYRGKYLLGGALAALFAMMQIAANHIQMTYYFIFVIVGFVIVYAITAWCNKQMRQWGIATGVLIIAAILATTANLPSLYNTYKYSKETIRGGHSELTQPKSQSNTDGLDRSYITAYSYGASETFSLLIPNVKGGATARLQNGQMEGMSLDKLPNAEKYQEEHGQVEMLRYLPQYFGEPEGTNGPVYVGALIVALFLLGCVIVRGSMKWILIFLTLLSILLALGRNCMWLTDLMIDYMPLYDKFRTPESILVIAEFTMPLLAALALQQLLTGKPAECWSKYSRPIIWCFGVVITICAIGVVMPSIFGEAVTDNDRYTNAMILSQMQQAGYPQDIMSYVTLDNPMVYDAVEQIRLSMVKADCLRSLLIIIIGLALLLLYLKKKISIAVTMVGLSIVVLGDLYLVNKRYLSSDSFTDAAIAKTNPFPLSESDRSILSDTTQNYRVLDIPRFAGADPSYHHKAIGGYHAAKLTRYQDIIDRQLRPFMQRISTADDLYQNNVVNMLNGRYIVINPKTPAVFNHNAMGNAWLVDNIQYVDTPDAEMGTLSQLNIDSTAVADKKFESILGQSTPKSEGDTIYETTYAPNRLTYHVKSANGGVAVFSEVYFPWGWHASIDGTPVEIGRVNYILRAIKVPAGVHSIEMVFNPQSLHTTTNAAYVAIILIYIALIAAVVLYTVPRKRKSNEDSVVDKTQEVAN